jgi:hypothetical protein
MDGFITGASRSVLAALLLSACNGQFDFDTQPLEASTPSGADAPLDNTPTEETPVADAPRTGIQIACGALVCSSPACCSTQAGFTCVDIADGGTCSGLTVQCDDSDDCPAGQVCCAEGDDLGPAVCAGSRDCTAFGKPQRVHCETEAHCRSMNFVILCNPDRPSVCAQCVATSLTGLPPNYHQCAAVP